VHNNIIIVNVCARHIISIEGNFNGEQRGNGFGFQTILMIIKIIYCRLRRFLRSTIFVIIIGIRIP